MSTRATICFKDRHDEFYVYRHCDGFPQDVLPEINAAIEKAKGRWSEPECGMLVTLFLAMHYDPSKSRLPDYHVSRGFAGDESYRYLVEWDWEEKEWEVEVT